MAARAERRRRRKAAGAAPRRRTAARGPRDARDFRDGRGLGARLWRYGPVVLWAGVIFFASTASLSASNTSRIVRPLLLWLHPGISEAELVRAHFFVRKSAHFTEYAVLALLAARAFLSSSRGFLRRRWALCALALVVACALLDEYHQSFLPARTGTVYDSLIDAAGGACALGALHLWRSRRRRRK